MKIHKSDLYRIFKFEFRITFTYLIFGLLWILFSDKVLDLLVKDVSILTEFQTYKGAFFIFVTSGCLYLLVKRHMQSLRFAESKLIESESHYKALFNDNHSVIVLINPDNARIEDANPAACKYYGWTHSELCSKSVYDLSTLDKDQVSARLQAIKEEKKNYLVAQHRHSSGEIRDVEIFSGPIRIGNKTMLYSNIHDITEQKKALEIIKQAEEELRRSKKLLAETESIGKVGGWEFSTDTLKTTWTDELYRIHEVDLDFNHNVNTGISFYTPASQPIIEQAVQRAIEFGESFDLELEIITSKGNLRSVHSIGKVDAENRRIYGFFQDITDRRQAEQAVQKLNSELEQRVVERTSQLEAVNKELEAFSYSVSHDLRAPLRHINGYVELLNNRFSEKLPEKAIHYLSTIADSTKQMGSLIDDLLQFSRTGRQELKKAKFDMNTLVNEIIDKLKKDINHRKISWSVQELPEVFGDISMLRQVWVNLIENAVKYTRFIDSAEITIAVRVEKNNYIFSIRDNGVGFDMKYAHKLFGVFQRLHSQADFEGTGIGLANVQRIIIKHNGKVWTEAEPNKGATFYFSLPKKGGNL